MKSWIKKKSNAEAEQAVPATNAARMTAGQNGAPQGQPQYAQTPYGQTPQGAAPQIMPQIVGGQAYPGVQPAQASQHMVNSAPTPYGAPQSMPPNQGLPLAQQPRVQGVQAGAQLQHPYGQPNPQPQPAQQMQAPQMHAPQMHAPQMQPHMSAAPMGHSPIPAPHIEQNREEGERALPAISIHAFCDRPETAGAIQATTRDWRMNRANLKVYMGGLPGAVEFYHNENTPNLIMIESGMRGAELFGQLESLASVCDEGTKVVIIGASNDIRLYRELMEKGVSDYLVPPFHPLTLIRSMSDLYADPDKPFTGRVAAFFGAKGGVGSSTLAHNVAWILATRHNQETALVDLDASWGTTGLDFNYDNVQGLEEALASPDRLDETLLDRIMLRHTEKLSLLPAAASLNNAGMENSEAFEAVVDGIRKISPLSILDLPHYWTDWTSKTLIGSDDVIITATPDLANLRNTKNLIDFLRANRPNDPDPILILNKTGVPKTPEIPVKDFATALGLEPTLVLPYEPVLYAQASNDGKMLSDMKSDSKAVEGFAHLGHRLRTGSFNGQHQKSGAHKSGSLLSKFIKKK